MKILVTGGCGFIGSNFIQLLLEKGHLVVNVDSRTYAGQGKNLDHMGIREGEHYKFYKCDIGNKEFVEDIFKKEAPEAVVNFAAESHVDRSIESSAPFVCSNVLGTQNLLDAARKFGIGKFVQIGTDEVYGSLSEDAEASREGDPLNPRSPYSSSKAAADLLALSYFHTHGLPVCVTRSSNNYGPFQFPEKVIPLFVTNLLQGKKVPLYGDGMNVRDWIHVRDNCDAVYQVLIRGKPGEIYNIGGGNQVRNVELTKLILEEMGLGGDMVEHVADRKGHDRRYDLSFDKIHEELGWMPVVDFESGLRATIDWYKENRKWWEPLITIK